MRAAVFSDFAPAVRLDELLDDGEAEPRAAPPLRVRLQLVENLFDPPLRYPRARVTHPALGLCKDVTILAITAHDTYGMKEAAPGALLPSAAIIWWAKGSSSL